MGRSLKRRDSALIDAIEAVPPERFEGTVWRVAREHRDPCQCSASGGRWDDGTFDVLYTSLEQNGAIAEMYFHLARGQPVFPSRVRYRTHELAARLERSLKLLDLSALTKLGADPVQFGRLAYNERSVEYTRTQEIGEVAHFLEFDGLLVPNARWDCQNAVLFCDCVPVAQRAPVKDHGLIDWRAWEREHKPA